MAKKRNRRRPRSDDKVSTTTFTDDGGNVLELRDALSAKTVDVLREAPGGDAASVDDIWQRRTEMLFERLAVSWEIAGLPLTDQAMLLGRYRMADLEMKRWVRETIAGHVRREMPDLDDLLG